VGVFSQHPVHDRQENVPSSGFSYRSHGFETLVLTLPLISGSCQLEEQGLAPKQALDACLSDCHMPVSVGLALKSYVECRFGVAEAFTRHLFDS